MTVAELIERLREQPQQAEVMLDEYGGLVRVERFQLLPEDDTTLLLVLRSSY